METTGCGTAIVTPFRADGSVDEPALWALVNWQIESGIDFLVACGSTGEAATLEEDEWLNTVRIVVEAAAGRVPVWGGCTHNCTKTLVRQAGLLDAGSRAQRRPVGQSLLQQAHAGGPVPALSRACARPSTRSRSASTTCPDAPARILSRRPSRASPPRQHNIQAIKEASGKLTQFAELAHILPRWFKIFSGDDNLTLGAIGVGAHGLISVASNEIPAKSPAWSAPRSTTTGRKPASWSAASRLFRGQFLGVESRPGQDGAQPDGQMRRPPAPAAGSAHGGYARPPRAPRRRTRPAQARAHSAGLPFRSFLEARNLNSVQVRTSTVP